MVKRVAAFASIVCGLTLTWLALESLTWTTISGQDFLWQDLGGSIVATVGADPLSIWLLYPGLKLVALVLSLLALTIMIRRRAGRVIAGVAHLLAAVVLLLLTVAFALVEPKSTHIMPTLVDIEFLVVLMALTLLSGIMYFLDKAWALAVVWAAAALAVSVWHFASISRVESEGAGAVALGAYLPSIGFLLVAAGCGLVLWDRLTTSPTSATGALRSDPTMAVSRVG